MTPLITHYRGFEIRSFLVVDEEMESVRTDIDKAVAYVENLKAAVDYLAITSEGVMIVVLRDVGGKPRMPFAFSMSVAAQLELSRHKTSATQVTV